MSLNPLFKRLLVFLGLVSLALLLAGELIAPRPEHAAHPIVETPLWHEMPGAYGVLGLVFTLALVSIARILAVIVERNESEE